MAGRSRPAVNHNHTTNRNGSQQRWPVAYIRTRCPALDAAPVHLSLNAGPLPIPITAWLGSVLFGRGSV
jgi:hypothetical protein